MDEDAFKASPHHPNLATLSATSPHDETAVEADEGRPSPVPPAEHRPFRIRVPTGPGKPGKSGNSNKEFGALEKSLN